MKPVNQTVFNSKNGDCMRACIAGIFELPLERVPNFMSQGEKLYSARLDAWARQHGYAVLSLNATLDSFAEYVLPKLVGSYVVCGAKSKAFNGSYHAVVAFVAPEGLRIVHDPNPKSPEEYRAKDVEIVDVFIRLAPKL